MRKGELLVRFDAPPLRSDLATRSGELAAARARVENARKNETRVALLLEHGIASRKEVEDAQRELREAEAAVRQGTGTQAAAADLVAQTSVHARFNGVVAHRSHNPGDAVEAVATDPVLRVVDPTRMQITASVPVADLTRISIGQPVLCIGNLTVGGSGKTPVVAMLAELLRDAGFAPAVISRGYKRRQTRQDVVIVPALAVVRDEDKTYVYVLGADQKAHRKAVVLGIVAGEDAEIRSGVVASEKVIVKGQEELPDGAAVTVMQK